MGNIIDQLCELLGIYPAPDQAAINYRDTGLVDSLGVVRLVLKVEEIWGIELTEADIAKPGFDTIGGLAAIIGEKLK